MTTEAEIAWAAGIFEGEGTLLIADGTSTIGVRVGMTDRDVVERYARIMQSRFAGPYQYEGNKKPYWVAVNQGWSELARIFDLFKPWLGERRTERFERTLEKRYPDGMSLPCGRDPGVPSVAGFMAHVRRRESPCRDCRDARSLYLHERRIS